ncbi:class I SAM-dependent methyltransferase [Sphaerisporangium sp. NPDC051011]|uniref:class I SAM-dependent methyltransferase n=1 Tax=Sphaerisporangium sp. NPDC051011 TaxID=3155792 RepID=UPI00340E8BD6
MDLRDHPPPRRSRRPADLTASFEWTRAPGVGPPLSVLGDLSGRRIAELGCGSGHNLAHLAAHHRLHAVGIDHDPTKIRRARVRYGAIPGLTFVHADATTHLREQPAGSLDLCLSIFGAFSFTDPAPLVAAVAHALRPGGLLALTFRTNDTTDLVLILTRN